MMVPMQAVVAASRRLAKRESASGANFNGLLVQFFWYFSCALRLLGSANKTVYAIVLLFGGHLGGCSIGPGLGETTGCCYVLHHHS